MIKFVHICVIWEKYAFAIIYKNSDNELFYSMLLYVAAILSIHFVSPRTYLECDTDEDLQIKCVFLIAKASIKTI